LSLTPGPARGSHVDFLGAHLTEGVERDFEKIRILGEICRAVGAAEESHPKKAAKRPEKKQN